MADQAQVAFEAAKATYGHLVVGLGNLQWEQLPGAIVDYLKNNPATTASQIVSLLVFLCPGVVATSALLGLGFGSGGPMAGWVAATFQSMYGTPVVFSALQSAAMGGWGTAGVHAVVQGGAVVVGGVTEALKWKSKL